MTIRKLPESMVVRIAAGEVIERPASVVKELVENAYDAGARNIAVRIRNGGLGLIEVSDDGCGIPSGELPLSVERHATSKIASEADLHAIRTMGFRGEALAAIAAAGRLTIVSRVAGSDAMQLDVDDSALPGTGEYARIVPAARAPGTTVLVRDLFAKTPARLKFMKSETAELSRISDTLERLALGRPDVSLSLAKDSSVSAAEARQVFRTPGQGRLRDVVLEIFGTDLAGSLLDTSGESSSGRLEGLCSPTHVTRRNRTGFYLNLDGRPIEDRSISHAITSAYEGLLPGGQFPIVFLTLRLDPADIDVNVHPAKAEVRFRDMQGVHRLVSSALRARLRGDVSPPSLSTPPSTASSFSFSGAQASPLPAPPEATQAVLSALFDEQASLESTAHPPDQAELAQPGQSPGIFRSISLRYSGEIAGRYLLAETQDGLVIIDQHAAHERILFDRLMRDAANGEVVVTSLLTPLLVELPASDRALAEELAPALMEIGIEIEPWPDAIAVRSVPALLGKIGDAARIVRDAVGAVREGGAAKKYKVPYEKLAMEACKAAVKGTQRLHPDEAARLLHDLRTTTDPYNCPHGRPTMIRMTVAELDRRFGRA